MIIKMLLSKIKNLFTRKKDEQPSPLEQIYEYNGKKFYQFASPDLMPVRRMLDIQCYAAATELKFSKETLSEALNKVIEFMDKGKIVDASVMIKELQIRADLVVAEEALMYLAALYFPMDGETINPPNELELRQKIKLWNSETVMYDFFLQKCITYTDYLTNTSPKDTTKYLAVTKELQGRLNSLLQ